MEHVLAHTEIIDCGESDVDNNRWIWDGLAVFKEIIYTALGNHA